MSSQGGGLNCGGPWCGEGRGPTQGQTKHYFHPRKDVLYAGGETWRDAELTVPHPRIGERRFVLEPLAAVRPGLVLPGQERSVAELLAGLESGEGPLRVYCEGDWR